MGANLQLNTNDDCQYRTKRDVKHGSFIFMSLPNTPTPYGASLMCINKTYTSYRAMLLIS